MHNYDDIIDIDYPFKLKHPRMSIYNRSSQFAPFAALTGHKESIDETSRITDEKKILDDDLKELINQQLLVINQNINCHPKVSITYFVKDKSKEGGIYNTIKEAIKKIDTYNNNLILMNKKKIPIDDIIDICIIDET